MKAKQLDYKDNAYIERKRWVLVFGGLALVLAALWMAFIQNDLGLSKPPLTAQALNDALQLQYAQEWPCRNPCGSILAGSTEQLYAVMIVSAEAQRDAIRRWAVVQPEVTAYADFYFEFTSKQGKVETFTVSREELLRLLRQNELVVFHEQRRYDGK